MSEEKKEAPPAPPKSGKKKLIVIGAAATLLLGGGGGAAWYFLKPKPDAAEHADAAHAKDKKARVFVNLDPFTVNLADDGGERFAQISVVLEVGDAKINEQVSAHMPAVRNAVLLLISSKESRELLTVPGKEQLAHEIASTAARQLGWEGDDAADAPKKIPASAKAADDKHGDGEKAAQADDAEKPAKPKPKKAKKSEPNPIEAVHFAQFIVQ
jgi:flagellar FliL protein